MKKKSLVVLIMTTICLLLCACGKDKTSNNSSDADLELFVGTWNVSFISEGGSIHGTLSAFKGTNVDEKIEIYKTGSGKIIFKLDDTSLPDYKYSMTWTYEDNVIRITDENNVIEDYIFDKDKMTLTSADGRICLNKVE